VDANLWAEDFGELLSMAGPRSAVEFRPPAPSDPTRCLLLAIACRDAAGNSETNQRRFVWRGQVRRCKKPAAYAVSGADWLLLVEKLGLVGELVST
jgi:hypothetical protein